MNKVLTFLALAKRKRLMRTALPDSSPVCSGFEMEWNEDEGGSSVEELDVNSWTFNRDCGLVRGVFGLVVWLGSGDGRRANLASEASTEGM